MSGSKDPGHQANGDYREPSTGGEPRKLAGLSERLIAAIIDGVIVGAILSVIGWPLILSGIIPWFMTSIFFAAMGFGIFAGLNFKFLQQGQTIGKKVMNLKIESQEGHSVDVQELLIKRYGVFFGLSAIPFLGAILALVNVLLVFRESRLAGHDEVAHTRVVYA